MQDPNFLPAYNTLGVVYMRHGNKPQAEFAFHTVLERDPHNTVTMSNEVKALKDIGRVDEANTLNVALERLQPNPPFFFFNQGVEAMNKGDYKVAKDLFSKEVDRAPYYHEFHFWLALAHYRLGEMGQARKELNQALENSVTIKQHSLYAAKLESLKAYGMR
jgi:Flp pilus assembly protein TadD